MTNDEGSVLVVAAMWWPLSARLAAAFVRQGVVVAVASHRRHPLRFVDGVARHYPYGGMDSLRTLRQAMERERPALVVPCDDGVVWQMHRLHALCPELRPLIERSLGRAEGYAIVRSREKMLRLAREMGIRVPETIPAFAGMDLSWVSAGRPAVLKVDGTCGGNGVQIARSAEEGQTALGKLATPVSGVTAWKQMAIDRNALGMFAWREGQRPNVTLQEYVAGRPANAMVACRAGEVVGLMAVEVVTAHGATGAATVVRVIENAAIRDAARLLAKRLGLSGFYGLDFLLEQGTGEAVLIELNPRATQLGHLNVGGGDLAGALCEAFFGGERKPSGEAIASETIAFFPQAVSLNPESPYVANGYHDVPLDQPRLHRELLRVAWPDRCLPARAYHLLRPRRRCEEVCFDAGSGRAEEMRRRARRALPMTGSMLPTG